MFLKPVLMVLLPLAAFVRIKWANVSAKRQRDAIRAAFAVGMLGLLGMTAGLGVAGPLYAHYWLGLDPPAAWPVMFPIFLFFGAITFYRCFASIAYLVLDGVWLAHRVIGASLVAGLAWLAAMPLLDPLASFGVFATTASVLIVAALSLSVRRTLRAVEPVAAERTTTEILGTPIAITDHPRAAARVLGWVRDRQSRYVCVRDVHGIMLAQRDPALMTIHRDADLILPDGMPLVHIARWRGHRSIGRVSGPDFVETMADLGRAEGVRHYFYGGKPGVAERMAAALALRFPGLAVAGASSPPFGEVSERDGCAEIARLLATTPDIVWIGLGTPKQERWMRRYRDEMPGVTLIGVGAAFDFHAGDIRRAPIWMQRATLEWLHRLLSEPRRLWRRYLVLAPVFVWRVLWDRST
jgi:N-acetylglucosaminyldiphosphoundecaprenol N-acetyl-beta-D-mannosaminyltransferase